MSDSKEIIFSSNREGRNSIFSIAAGGIGVPESLQSHSALAVIYLIDSRPELALREIQLEPDSAFQLQGRALVYPALGQQAQGEASLAQLIEEYQEDSAHQIAEVFAYWGDVDAAFEWLEKAYSQSDAGLGLMKADPLLANLHDDPRWTTFLKKIGLVP